MSLRQRDVKQWMRHRRLPQELRRSVVYSFNFSSLSVSTLFFWVNSSLPITHTRAYTHFNHIFLDMMDFVMKCNEIPYTFEAWLECEMSETVAYLNEETLVISIKPCVHTHTSIRYFSSWTILLCQSKYSLIYVMPIAIPFYCFFEFPSIIFLVFFLCTCKNLLLCMVAFFGICYMDLVTY